MRKGVKLALVAAVCALIALLWWPKGIPEPFDVLYRNRNGIVVGSVSVEGSLGGEASQYASGKMMQGGDKFPFAADTVGWPMEVAIYQGLDMKGVIATVTIPSAPGEDQYWLVEPVRQDGRWTLQYQLAERG